MLVCASVCLRVCEFVGLIASFFINVSLWIWVQSYTGKRTLNPSILFLSILPYGAWSESISKGMFFEKYVLQKVLRYCIDLGTIFHDLLNHAGIIFNTFSALILDRFCLPKSALGRPFSQKKSTFGFAAFAPERPGTNLALQELQKPSKITFCLIWV